MNKTIRIIAVASAVATATVGLAACSSGASTGADGKIGGTITVTTGEKFAPQVAKAFEKKYPGTTVKITYVSDVTAMQQTVRTQLASGTASDVLNTFPGNGSPLATQVLAKAGTFLYDLSNRPWVKKLPKNIVESGSYDGKLYTGLYTVNGIGGIYNKTALDLDGQKAPTTFPEVLKLCAAAHDHGKVAYALGNQDQWVTQLINYALTSTLVYGPDPDFVKKQLAGKATFADSGWAKSFKEYQQMSDSGCFEKDPLTTGYAATQQMVAAGKAYGLVNGNWALADVKTAGPNNTYEMDAFPATDNASDTRMPVAAGSGLGVNARSKNLATAIAYVDFAMSPEGMAISIPQTGGLPSYDVSTVKIDPTFQVVADYLKEGKGTPFPDQGWPNSKVQAEHLTGVQAIFAGSATASEVLQKMQTAFASK